MELRTKVQIKAGACKDCHEAVRRIRDAKLVGVIDRVSDGLLDDLPIRVQFDETWAGERWFAADELEIADAAWY